MRRLSRRQRPQSIERDALILVRSAIARRGSRESDDCGVCLEHRNTVAAQPAPPNSLHAYCGQRALATRTGRPVAFSAVIGRVSMGAAGGLGAAPRVGGGPLAAPPAPRVATSKQQLRFLWAILEAP